MDPCIISLYTNVVLLMQIDEVAEVLHQLINDNITWDEVYAKYPHQEQPQD